MKRLPILIALSGLLLAGPVSAAPKPAGSAKPPIVKSGARLDDVHIKGEIPEPQVLFVVGRERRRFLDFQHRRYLEARAVAGGPSWVRVVDSGRAPAD